jgi:hypothetical protein
MNVDKSGQLRTLLMGISTNGEASFDSFVIVGQELLEGLSLGRAAWDDRNLRPDTSFFSLVDNDFQFHERQSRVRPRVADSICSP